MDLTLNYLENYDSPIGIYSDFLDVHCIDFVDLVELIVLVHSISDLFRSIQIDSVKSETFRQFFLNHISRCPRTENSPFVEISMVNSMTCSIFSSWMANPQKRTHTCSMEILSIEAVFLLNAFLFYSVTNYFILITFLCPEETMRVKTWTKCMVLKEKLRLNIQLIWLICLPKSIIGCHCVIVSTKGFWSCTEGFLQRYEFFVHFSFTVTYVTEIR